MSIDETERRVFKQVRRCMQNLVGGSGHLAAYHISEDSFQITSRTDLGDGLTAYEFQGLAGYESEFTVACEPDLDPAPWAADREQLEEVAGRIVLDESFSLTRDESGRVRLDPWKCLDPDKLGGDMAEGAGQDGIDALLRELSSWGEIE